MTELAEWVAVDWGTSNLRAWGVDSAGGIAFLRQSPEGMGKLSRKDYPRVLSNLLGTIVSGSMDVLICGMAGARQGWLEAPYLDTPADLGALGARAVAPPMPGSSLRPTILPGVRQMFSGDEDVMRGEETQLLGLSTLIPDFSGLVVMPGTHSKWVTLANRRISRFSTAMTGELFDILSTHSVLRHSLAGEADAKERHAGFDAGLDAGLDRPERLASLLFKVRTATLLAGRSPAWCSGFLSGVLIGAEIGGQRTWISGGNIPLVGGAELCQLYARGFERLGATCRTIDATEATLAGLKAARGG